jgi:hypothetical protein
MSGQALWNPAWEPDMSGSRDLTRDKAERPDMSGKPLWNTVSKTDKSSWDLATEELGLGWTCLVQKRDMSGKGYWNPASDPDKSG